MGKAGQTGSALTKCNHISLVSIPVCPAFFNEAHSSRTFLDHSNCETALAEGSGRPLGTAEFVTGLEQVLGRPIAHRAPGRNPRAASIGRSRANLPGFVLASHFVWRHSGKLCWKPDTFCNYRWGMMGRFPTGIHP